MRAAVLSQAMRRARKDPLARLLAAATEAGVRFRFAGASLQVQGVADLHPTDQAVLRAHLDAIRERLTPPEPETDLLTELDVQVEVVDNLPRARQVLAELRSPRLGFDVETAPLAPNGNGRWLRITRAGALAKHQGSTDANDGAALDPQRARIRLSQVYDPDAGVVYVIDHDRVPVDALKSLQGRGLYAHNAAFEQSFARAAGVECLTTWCTKQLAQLALGAERGGLKLAEVAETLLELSVPKHEQLSDWSAPRLSLAQIEYAAVDAVLAHRVGERLRRDLDAETKAAFRLANSTIPIVADMRRAGVPFDVEVHREQVIPAWEDAYTRAREEFVALTGEEIPPAGPQRSAWLERRIPAHLQPWPRTDGGQIRQRRSDLERLAGVPEIRPLLTVDRARKRLTCFGAALLEHVGADGRLRFDLKPAATKTGRCSCSNPNAQQLPADARHAIRADGRRAFITADYAQLELRTAAARSGDPTMTAAFAEGRDLHAITASAITGKPLEEITSEDRRRAKPVNFGSLYGQGAFGLVGAAWAGYGVVLTEAEAQVYLDRFRATYPVLAQWQRDTYQAARQTGVLRSIAGRPLRVDWEPYGLKWTLCCNFPIQSSAADVVMLAMTKADKALDKYNARLVLQIHDELLVEVAEEQAAEALVV